MAALMEAVMGPTAAPMERRTVLRMERKMAQLMERMARLKTARTVPQMAPTATEPGSFLVC